MSEHEFEAVRGLPGDLPEGETVLWQGAPDWFMLAMDAFKLRWVIGYFVLLTGWRFINGMIFLFLSWVNSRSTVYTVTSHRIVMRFGAALTKAINIPFKIIESASSDVRANGSGVVAVKLAAPNKIPVLLLWPHKKPGTIRHPEPAFRCIKDADKCAPILAEALRIAHEQRHAVSPSVETADARTDIGTQAALA
jgi:Bacterial PH domain